VVRVWIRFRVRVGIRIAVGLFPSLDLCWGRSRSTSGGTSLDPILGASRGPKWRRIMFPSYDLCRSRSPSGGTSLHPILDANRGPNW
jgi:hypothetical protein